MNFNEQFNSFYPTLVAIARRYARSTDIPLEEYESSLSEEFYLKFDDFDPSRNNNFTAFMRVVLTQRASRVANRREREFYEHVEFYESPKYDEEGDEQEFDLESDFDLEEHVIESILKKTDEDKRQLISDLLENTDSITKRIVKEVIRSEHAKPTVIGKALGIHHQIVTRKLSYLSRNFNERQFGEVSLYLAS